MRIQAGSVLAIATVLAPVALPGQPSFGPALRVNGNPSGADGQFAVVWRGDGQDRAQSGIDCSFADPG